jgi:hypothetical protein
VKVYIVLASCAGELMGIDGVFKIKEEAEKYITDSKNNSDFYIEEHELL